MKVTAPMMSLDASGTIAGTITAAKWKGRNYMRQTVKPSNPRSQSQTVTRAMFAFLGKSWAQLDQQQKTSWEDLASATNITPFNAYVQFNGREWTQDTPPIADYNADAPVNADNITTFTATAGVKQNTISAIRGAAEEGDWAVVFYRSLTTGGTKDHSEVIAVVYAGTELTINYVDTGLKSGTEYFYQARLINNTGGWGSFSAEASATPN